MNIEYKEYIIENDGVYGMKNIKQPGRGSVNLLLRGTYTSWHEAMKAIDTFIANRGKEENGERLVETVSPGRGK